MGCFNRRCLFWLRFEGLIYTPGKSVRRTHKMNRAGSFLGDFSLPYLGKIRHTRHDSNEESHAYISREHKCFRAPIITRFDK